MGSSPKLSFLLINPFTKLFVNRLVGDSAGHGDIGIGVLSRNRGGIGTESLSCDLGGIDGSILI